jgi:hypothetical protein
MKHRMIAPRFAGFLLAAASIGATSAAPLFPSVPDNAGRIGNLLLPQLGIHLGSGIVMAIIYATIGALILLFILRPIRDGRRWGWGRR